LPFERTIFYLLYNHLSRFLQTKIPDAFYFIGSSDYKTTMLKSLMWMVTQL
jgi:hypothetical protein